MLPAVFLLFFALVTNGVQDFDDEGPTMRFATCKSLSNFFKNSYTSKTEPKFPQEFLSKIQQATSS